MSLQVVAMKTEVSLKLQESWDEPTTFHATEKPALCNHYEVSTAFP